MSLPPALAPWGPQLRIFPPEVALSLGPLLRRLASLIGPLRPPHQDGEGEVDGFDGLSRRGTYERLLGSEWLLADEAPEEFLRRASTGEHTFLRLARPEPRGSSRSVVLFDAGPDQLGAPRIVQLAALIVLARRAEGAGVPFAWGVLQRPEAPLVSGWSEAEVQSWLGCRTTLTAEPEHYAAWHERLGGWRELDDAWIVGAAAQATLRLPRPASRLEVRERLEIGARKLDVAVRRGGLPGREIALELPEPEHCVRLLRDPFAGAPGARQSLTAGARAGSNLLFSATGRHLVARAAQGGLLVVPVPNSPLARVPPPFRLVPDVPGDFLLAAGPEARRCSVLVSGEGGLELLSGGKNRELRSMPLEMEEGAPFVVALGTALQPLIRINTTFFVLDAEGTLFEIRGDPPRRLVFLQRHVMAWRLGRAGLVVAARDSNGSPRFLNVGPFGRCEQLGVYRDLQAKEAFFGACTPPGRTPVQAIGWTAVGSGGDWSLLESEWRSIRLPLEARVAGVAPPSHGQGASLVVVSPQRRALGLIGVGWSRRLVAAPAEFEEVAVCPVERRYAYTLPGGELVIGSVDSGAVFSRWSPEGA